jgi:hypothetical protein
MPKIIRITAKVPGFRRAGKAHPAHPVDYPAGDIPAEVLTALKTEPMLVVQELDLPDEPQPPLQLDGDGSNPDSASLPQGPVPVIAPDASDAADDEKTSKAGKAKAKTEGE